jgi:hypothetical protein
MFIKIQEIGINVRIKSIFFRDIAKITEIYKKIAESNSRLHGKVMEASRFSLSIEIYKLITLPLKYDQIFVDKLEML